MFFGYRMLIQFMNSWWMGTHLTKKRIPSSFCTVFSVYILLIAKYKEYIPFVCCILALRHQNSFCVLRSDSFGGFMILSFISFLHMENVMKIGFYYATTAKKLSVFLWNVPVLQNAFVSSLTTLNRKWKWINENT